MKLRYLALAVLAAPGIVHAQAIKPEPEIEKFTATQIAEVAMPDLQFEETQAEIDNYEKYFYFHRSDTSFDRAFADVSECDALASGIKFYSQVQNYNYTPAGIIGGAIGNVMADAIFGSAERRKIRRINVRRCMAFKGYARYGMEKERWQVFNFEEGIGSVTGDRRREFLLAQAKVASAAQPQQKVLAP